MARSQTWPNYSVSMTKLSDQRQGRVKSNKFCVKCCLNKSPKQISDETIHVLTEGKLYPGWTHDAWNHPHLCTKGEGEEILYLIMGGINLSSSCNPRESTLEDIFPYPSCSGSQTDLCPVLPAVLPAEGVELGIWKWQWCHHQSLSPSVMSQWCVVIQVLSPHTWWEAEW